ncbi:MAG TPA: hypothetical protein VGK87_16435, partial [Anaerolineae bacterium]
MNRKQVFATVATVSMLALSACNQQAAPSGPPTPVTPKTVQQDSIPQPAAPSTSAGSGQNSPSAGPNLLAKNWNERLGILVSDYQAPKGQPVLNPKAGDLWFFSNASTTWGATNTKNSVWVIDAKTKKTVAEIAPADGEGYSSHGIFISGDAKFVYLPELGKDNHIDVLDGRTLEV